MTKGWFKMVKISFRMVQDLNREELDELKESYFDQLTEEDEEICGDDIMSFEQIPDSVIFEHYDGITFMEDDFFCNQ